jgi:hypothetical protein
VKAQLVALWHQSLARSQRGRSRTVLSNSNKDANKKANATWKGWKMRVFTQQKKQGPFPL